MIQTLKNRHENKTIAIIGSGETALQYKGEEDISIALNGAIQLEQRIDYSMMFDTSLFRAGFFNIRPEIPRIMGCGLAPLSPLLYQGLPDEKIRKIKGSSVTEFDYPDPKPPHVYFKYITRQAPVFDKEMTCLSSVGNIAIPALETAIIMGASEIHIYGVDMNKRVRFYEGFKDLGSYCGISARYMNSLIELAEKNGIIIRVARSEGSKVTAGLNL